MTTKAANNTTDAVAGGLKFTITKAGRNEHQFTTTATTLSGLIAQINAQDIPGVTASFTTAGAVGDAVAGATAATDTEIQLANTNPNVVIAEGATALSDTTSAGVTALDANTAATTTIGYQFAAGGDTSADLAKTDLLNPTDAQTALTVLNQAVTDVASQDGYIGAQINTLNSLSQIMSTQQENVVSAQNAIQATDYASATSNMSKYEILSQTGIAALAQANQVQQEVTKLFQ